MGASRLIQIGSRLGRFANAPPRVRPLSGARGRLCPEEATRVAQAIPPDILIYDSKLAASYSKNGLTLTDDVVSVFLSVLTKGRVTGENVGHHRDLLTDFPYLGPPHKNDSGS
jgi:hypothetical protein